MGYYVDITSSNAMVKKENLEAAHKAMCELNKRDDLKNGGAYQGGKQVKTWFAWMPEDYDVKLTTAKEILEHLGFTTEDSENGDLLIHHYSSKIGDEVHFFGAIAQYIVSSSLIVDDIPAIEWRGEDGETWRWVFDGGRMYVQEGYTDWGPRKEYVSHQ